MEAHEVLKVALDRFQAVSDKVMVDVIKSARE